LSKYYDRRAALIEQEFSKPNIGQRIDEAISKVFQTKFNERLDAYHHIAKVAQFKGKQDLFSKVRNIILNRRLTKFGPSMDPNKWRGAERMLYFPKDDRSSFLDSYNQSLEDSTLFKRLYRRYTEDASLPLPKD
jgi:hypothetical protein